MSYKDLFRIVILCDYDLRYRFGDVHYVCGVNRVYRAGIMPEGFYCRDSDCVEHPN
jgi:hypothetical protein